MNNKVCFVRINLFFSKFKLFIHLLFSLPFRISWLDLPRIRGATRMQRLELNPRLNTNKERARRPLNKSFPPRPPQRILTDPPHYLTTVMKKRTRDKSASSWLVTHQCLSGFVPIPTRHFSVTLTSLSSSLFVARARPIQLVHPSLLPTDWPELVTHLVDRSFDISVPLERDGGISTVAIGSPSVCFESDSDRSRETATKLRWPWWPSHGTMKERNRQKWRGDSFSRGQLPSTLPAFSRI